MPVLQPYLHRVAPLVVACLAAGCASTKAPLRLAPGEEMTVWSVRGGAVVAEGTEGGLIFDELDLAEKELGIYVLVDDYSEEDEECYDPEEPAREKTEVTLGETVVLKTWAWNCEGDELLSHEEAFSHTAPPDEQRCTPSVWLFEPADEDESDWELELIDDCRTSIMADTGDGYAVHIDWSPTGLWSGSETFMSHPPHDRSMTLRWKHPAAKLELLEFSAIWDEWDDEEDWSGDEDQMMCIDDCEMNCDEGCSDHCVDEDDNEDPDCGDDCIDECYDMCNVECPDSEDMGEEGWDESDADEDDDEDADEDDEDNPPLGPWKLIDREDI